MTSMPPTNLEQSNFFRQLKEQLRLYSFDSTLVTPPDLLGQIESELNPRERLSVLLEGELDFHGEKTDYASHDLHAFAAKFPPQIARTFIRGLTKPGQIILDPMVGSGTTLVEALVEGRWGIGFDIDPLAMRLSKVKTTPLDLELLKQTGERVLSQAASLLSDTEEINRKLAGQFDDRTKEFIDYWFLPSTQRELMALATAISQVADIPTRQFLELTFSSTIVTKSGGVSRARDLAHTRPHLDKDKVPKNALDQFSTRLIKNLKSIAKLKMNGVPAVAVTGDARLMPLRSESIDLIVTSPPYANAIDYVRAHKFSLVWFGESVLRLKELRAQYIGSERIDHSSRILLPFGVREVIEQLAQLDSTKAAVLHKYYTEMTSVFREMFRVLRPDSPAIVVVGSSMMRGVNVRTHSCLSEIAVGLGFDLVGVARRKLDRDKRMMPASFGRRQTSTIEQRMHEEFVIGLLKPSQDQ